MRRLTLYPERTTDLPRIEDDLGSVWVRPPEGWPAMRYSEIAVYWLFFHEIAAELSALLTGAAPGRYYAECVDHLVGAS